MTRHKNSKGLVCAGCGHEIQEDHYMVYKIRDDKGFDMYHSECVHNAGRRKKKEEDS